MLVQGALLGILIGKIGMVLVPSFDVHPSTLGIIGMAAYFSAMVHTPLTGVILIAEMTADYNLLFYLLAASLISYIVAGSMNEKPIYETLMNQFLRSQEPMPNHLLNRQ